MALTNKRPTLQDVADRAGVSRTTASFVINGRDDMRISEGAQERVRRAARELNYRPNLMARSLSTQITRTIGLVSDSVTTDGYSGDLLEGCLAGALKADHMLYIGETGGDERLEAEVVVDLSGRHVDGFIYATTFTRDVRLRGVLASEPVVLINGVTTDRQVHCVIPDALEAGRTAGRHLVEMGHRSDIWMVGEVPRHQPAALERHAGLCEVLDEVGTTLAGVVDCNWWPESTYEALSALLADGVRPKAIVCLNDRVAVGVYQALRDAGLPVPDAVSVVSFDGSPIASWMRPQLTSIAIPHHQMGERAISLLLGDDDEPRVHRLAMPLRRAASVAAPT